jgi:hypothetical protein
VNDRQVNDRHVNDPEGPKAQRKDAEGDQVSVRPPDRPHLRRRRSFESGIGAILLVDGLALLLVIASGPAAYLWLDQSHPGPLSTPTLVPTLPAPTAMPDASPGGGSSAPGASLPPGSTGAPSAGASPGLVYGAGTWVAADPLPVARWATASAVLHDGRVMVVGGATGTSSFDAVAAAAIFDPVTGKWTAVTDMLQPRAYAMAVTLDDGSVLVAGGSENGQPLDTAERYNPSNGTWVAAGRLNLPRTQGTLTLLGDGRALAAGGGIEGSPAWTSTATAEIFDPTIGTWSLVAPMSVARARQTATLLQDGEVLVAGGATTYHGETGSVTATAEIFDPRADSWRAAPPMSEPRYVDAASLLRDGRVLVAGGWYSTSNSDPSHATAEIYDPATNRWAATGSMTSGRAEYSLVGLPDGRVLAAGGVDPAYGVQATSELFDPTTGTWQATGSLAVATMWPAAQALPDGRVLLAGGGLDALADRVTAACEIYSPPPPQAASRGASSRA